MVVKGTLFCLPTTGRTVVGLQRAFRGQLPPPAAAEASRRGQLATKANCFKAVCLQLDTKIHTGALRWPHFSRARSSH